MVEDHSLGAPVGEYPDDELVVVAPLSVKVGADVSFDDDTGVNVKERVPLLDEDVMSVPDVMGEIGGCGRIDEVAALVKVADEFEAVEESWVNVELARLVLLPEVPMLAQVVTVADTEELQLGANTVPVELDELLRWPPTRMLELAVVKTADPDAEPKADVVSLDETTDPPPEPDLTEPLLPVSRLDTPGTVEVVVPVMVGGEISPEVEFEVVSPALEPVFPETIAEEEMAPVTNI